MKANELDSPERQDPFTLFASQELDTECVAEYRFAPPRRWRFDYALPRYKIALEVEGGVWTRGRHVRPKGYINDLEKYNTATVMGWRVLRVQPKDLMTMGTITVIRTAMRGGLSCNKKQLSS